MRENTAVSYDQIDQLFTSRPALQGEIATFPLNVSSYKICQLSLQKQTPFIFCLFLEKQISCQY